ncbi:OadG family protein [Roseimarinus sediminis]|uniref:OadG family protein n=1 Tax=Roseimarinus sediminis TaxID=1610899 RepID=UPI003D1C6EC0
MNSNFDIALQLLGIGMLTVFIILFMVVLLGNLIIRFVNRFVPETAQQLSITKSSAGMVDAKKMAAIVAAVNMVSKGKGRVVKVEKQEIN